MLPLALQKIMDLARRTGDRCIVTDSEGENVFVLMPLAAYEELVAPTPFVDEDPFFEANARSEDDDLGNNDDLPEAPMTEQATGGSDEDRFYIEPVE